MHDHACVPCHAIPLRSILCIKKQYTTTHYLTLHDFTVHYCTLQYITLPYLTRYYKIWFAVLYVYRSTGCFYLLVMLGATQKQTGSELVRPIARQTGFATLPSQSSRANTPHRGGERVNPCDILWYVERYVVIVLWWGGERYNLCLARGLSYRFAVL